MRELNWSPGSGEPSERTPVMSWYDPESARTHTSGRHRRDGSRPSGKSSRAMGSISPIPSCQAPVARVPPSARTSGVGQPAWSAYHPSVAPAAESNGPRPATMNSRPTTFCGRNQAMTIPEARNEKPITRLVRV